MKIAIIEVGGWGGICHYTFNLAQALANNGQTQVVLITDSRYELEHISRDFSLEKIRFKDAPYLPAVFGLMRLLRRLKPDIIHVQSFLSVRRDWILFVLARMLGLRVVVTAHNILPHELCEQKAFFIRRGFGIVYSCAHKIIVHSRYSGTRLSEIFSIGPEKIAVIPHGNYLFARTRDMDRAQACAALGLPQDKKYILCFGALRPYKGIETLLEAFGLARERDSRARLVIAGPPIAADAAHYRAIVQRAGLGEDAVVRPVYVPFEDIQTYFVAADIVVFPYKEIDMSGSLQLAYCFARPVVATRVGGFPEVIEDGANGILVPAQDARALALALERLLSDPALQKRMGERSFDLARGRFSWEPIAAHTLEAYRGVLEKRRSAARLP